MWWWNFLVFCFYLFAGNIIVSAEKQVRRSFLYLARRFTAGSFPSFSFTRRSAAISSRHFERSREIRRKSS